MPFFNILHPLFLPFSLTGWAFTVFQADTNYKEVCSGTTGHAETIEVEYDPDAIRYEDLLDAFFRMHDPTTPNRQGPDVGSQYRSAIFSSKEDKLARARDYLRRLEDAGVFSKSIVTEITQADNFIPAEDYHQDYFDKNGGPSCHFPRKGPLLPEN